MATCNPSKRIQLNSNFCHHLHGCPFMIRHFISTSNFTGFFEILDLIFHDHVRLRIFHLMHELSMIYHEVNLMKLIRSFYCCLRTPLFLSSCLQCVCVSKKQQKDLIPSSGTKGSFCRAIKAFSGLFATLKKPFFRHYLPSRGALIRAIYSVIQLLSNRPSYFTHFPLISRKFRHSLPFPPHTISLVGETLWAAFM